MKLAISPPGIVKKVLSNFTWNIPNSGNKIFLTFDDGPTPKITNWVLEILQKHKAKATFFCVGNNVKKYPEIYEKIKFNGHSTGNHTFNHTRGFGTKKDCYISDFEEADNVIKSNLFRPPYGRITRKQSRYILQTHKIIMWDVLSADYNKKISPRACFLNVKNHTKAGSIIVFHDSVKAERNMKYALSYTLDHYQKQGYVFDKINPVV